MIEKEALSILQNEGWLINKDDTGVNSCYIEVESLLVRIIPTIKKRPGYFRISFMPSVSLITFSQVVDRIFNKRSGYEPIIVSNLPAEKIVDISKEDIVLLSKNAINWAAKQEIEKALKEYRLLPTSCRGAMPLRHLAALALHADIKKLSFYKKSFLNADRLEFVPYISIEMIDEALSIATDNLNRNK